MWERLHRLPSPAMAVAFVALLAALGGTAVALPGKNKVTSDDIAKGAVNNADLRKGAVTNAKVRNRSITGVKFRQNALGGNAVKESTLGRVPSADFAASAFNSQNAVNAQNANNAQNAANANRAASAGSVDGRTPFLVKLSAGQTQTIASNGAVSIQVQCISDGTDDEVRVLGATSASGAAQDGNDDFDGSSGNTLEPTTPAEDREILGVSDTTGDTNVDTDIDIDKGFVMAPDGKALGIDGETTALGVNFAGATCVAAGVVNAAG
jgi:hypothetical protein